MGPVVRPERELRPNRGQRQPHGSIRNEDVQAIGRWGERRKGRRLSGLLGVLGGIREKLDSDSKYYSTCSLSRKSERFRTTQNGARGEPSGRGAGQKSGGPAPGSESPPLFTARGCLRHKGQEKAGGRKGLPPSWAHWALWDAANIWQHPEGEGVGRRLGGFKGAFCRAESKLGPSLLF